jgi:hypothetical protein
VNKTPARPIEVYTTDEVVHVRVDAPGERAVSAPIPDVLEFITRVALEAGFDVDTTVPGEIYVSWPV